MRNSSANCGACHDYDDQSLSGQPCGLSSGYSPPRRNATSERPRSRYGLCSGIRVWPNAAGATRITIARVGSDLGFRCDRGCRSGRVLHRSSKEVPLPPLAIAASHAGGLASNFWNYDQALPCRTGCSQRIVAVRLAAAGMTAAHDTLENRQGFLNAFSPDSPDRDSPARVGTESYLLRQSLCIKKYPTCYFMHRSFDAAVKMLDGRRLTPDDISEIEVTMDGADHCAD